MHMGCNRSGHGKMQGDVDRAAVLFYFAKLTDKSMAISADTKHELWKLRALLTGNGGIPKSWQPKTTRATPVNLDLGD